MPARKVTRQEEGPIEPVETGEEIIERLEVEEDPVEIEEEVTEDTNEDDGAPLTLEGVDPTLELWEDGPTVADAIKFKEEFGDIFITTLTYDKFLLWKTLDRSEYRHVIVTLEEMASQGMSPAELNLYQEELISELCILSPKMTMDDFAGDLAGLPSLLSQQILEASGFTAIDTRGL